MAYSTIDDIKANLPYNIIQDLTDDDGFGDIDETKVTAAIAGADSEIDGYIGERYSLPLSSVPELVKTWSIDIAIYRLYKRRVEEVPETRRMAYKDALAKLEKINQGKMKLPITTPVADDFGFGVNVSSHFGDDNSWSP